MVSRGDHDVSYTDRPRRQLSHTLARRVDDSNSLSAGPPLRFHRHPSCGVRQMGTERVRPMCNTQHACRSGNLNGIIERSQSDFSTVQFSTPVKLSRGVKNKSAG